ncbi:MAG: prepilin peptidase [bacterium]|nr:prepilin peptidase [bacterium]
MLIFYALFLVTGLVVGSFLGMLTFRIPRKKKLSGRSFCDECGEKIRWFENIPILSFLLLGGRCRVCKKKISLRYPLIEVLAAMSFLAIGYLWSNLMPEQSLVFLLLLGTLLLGLLVTDIEFQTLPDEILLPLALLTFLALLFAPSPTLFTHLFWGFIVFLFFLAIYLLTHGRGMGFGDVKLVFILGSLLGYPGSLVWIFLSFLTGATSGLIMIIIGRAKRNSQIAFGPYLIFSFWIAIFWGKTIYEWYLNL